MKCLLIAASAAAMLVAAGQAMAQSDTMSSPPASQNPMAQSQSQGSMSQGAMSQGSMSQSGGQMSSDQSVTMKKHKKGKPASNSANMSSPNNTGSPMGTEPNSGSMSNPH